MTMPFDTQPHRFYCGIDLHARLLAVCIVDHTGTVVLRKPIPADQALLRELLAPFRPDVVIAVECLFAWYWVADFCAAEGLPFVLGHALYLKAIHGGKTKDDDIDAEKISRLLRGGTIPMAYVYPKGLRETRDLLRRRNYLVRKRAELIAHIQITNAQYNLPPFGKKLIYARNRAELKVAEHFPDAPVRKNIELDLALIDALDVQLADVELYLQRTAWLKETQRMPGIDYSALRCRLRLGQVLELLDFVPVSRHGPQVRGPCPVPGSRSRRSRSLAAHLGRQCWHCFRCGAGGNALDLWLAVTRLPLDEAALDLCRRLHLDVPWCAPARRSAAHRPPDK
jgi:hypothetical protein